MNSRFASSRHPAHPQPPAPADFAPIGDAAGILWQVLSDDGPMTFACLMEEVNLPESLFFMAVGWLAREDKIEIESREGDYELRLKSAA